MNNFGEIDLKAIIGSIFGIIILALFISAVSPLFHQTPCPTCDCSAYQNQLSECDKNVSNLSERISKIPTEYVYVNNTLNNTIEKVFLPEEKPLALTLNILIFIISLSINISLFKIKIKLPTEIEEKLKKFEKAIKYIKIASLILTILIFVKLLVILFL